MSKDRIETDVLFAIVPEWVIFHEDLTHAAVRVYAALVRHANGGQAFPSLALLSRECHCSPDTVRRAIGQLEEVGAVESEPRFEDGRQTSNLYTVYTTPPGGRVAPVQGGRVAPMQGEGVAPVQGEEREKKEREKNPLSSGDDEQEPYTMSHVEAFDALAKACGLDADGIRKVGGGLIGKNAKVIRELRVTEDDVLRRAALYRSEHPDWELTPASLVKWWPTLDAGAGTTPETTCECGQALDASHDQTIHDVLTEAA